MDSRGKALLRCAPSGVWGGFTEDYRTKPIYYPIILTQPEIKKVNYKNNACDHAWGPPSSDGQTARAPDIRPRKFFVGGGKTAARSAANLA